MMMMIMIRGRGRKMIPLIGPPTTLPVTLSLLMTCLPTYLPTYIHAQATPDLLASRLIIMNPSLPIDRARDLVAFTRGTIPIHTPLYLCPVRGAGVRQPFSPHGHINTLFMEVCM